MDIISDYISVSLGVDGTCMITPRYYQRVKDGSIRLDVLDVPDPLLIPQSPAESSGGGVDYFPEDDADLPISDSYPESSPPLLLPEVTDPSPKHSAPSPVKHNNTVYFPEYVCQVSIIEYFTSFIFTLFSLLVFHTIGLLQLQLRQPGHILSHQLRASYAIVWRRVLQ